MNFRTLSAALISAVGLVPTGGGTVVERNVWPVWVVQVETAQPERTVSFAAAGPFGFYRAGGERNPEVRGVRPFYIEKRATAVSEREAHVLYPFFTYRESAGGRRWSVLNLINRSTGRTDGLTTFDVWPFYFSRQTGDPATSYRAVFPLYGAVKQRFGQDRFSWILFPLYGRFEKQGTVTTTTPWPFVKVLRGDGHKGFELWPLGGRREKAGSYREQFYLWPLIYKNERYEGLEKTSENLGVLPFYARDLQPGYRSETFGWPFFGYVDRTEPYRYRATNYFWPLLVQGRGDQRYVNRWAPFYSRSEIKGTDKTWIMWPLWRRVTWTDAGLDHERRQFLYFLYNDNLQRSATRADLAGARKTHVWPLLTYWNNGAGRRQWQVLSPFEVFFPHNEPVRLAWSPFFALYRYDRRGPGESRHSLLWDGVTYHRQDEGRRSAFHLGPLFSNESGPEGKRIALGNGLLGLKRTAGTGGWRLFFGEFKPRARPAASSSP